MEQPAIYYSPWNNAQKFFFRFFCCLFLVYIFPFPIDSIPFISELNKLNENVSGWYPAVFEAYTNLWHAFIPWIAKHLLGMKTPITIFSNGSGDTTYDYVLLLTMLVLATLAAVIWSVADRNRKSYRVAYYWLRVLVRYFLAAMMLGYGFAKVFHLQMPFPALSTLVQPFGDKSPMGLAWSFIGYSKAYSAYTGWGEVLGGVLLLFRRTATLGAIVSVVVMLNVFVLNLCYDIPVKLFSFVLLLMAAFLAAHDARRLLNVLILNKPASPGNNGRMLARKKMTRVLPVLKWVFIFYLFYSNISGDIDSLKQYGDDRKKPALYGIYNTETVVRNKDTIAPLTTDTTRWKQLIIQAEKYATVKLMNDSVRRYNFITDTVSSSVSVFTITDTLNKSKLFYHADADYLELRGRIKSDSVYMRFKKYDINKFRLVNRGFHWINEYPFNR